MFTRTRRLSAAGALAALSALAPLAAAAPASAAASDFPTLARVEFVLQCMALHGGQSYDTMYSCVCMIDKLAENYAYKEYTQAQTLSFLYGTPGEKGGVFRDAAPDARSRVEGLKAHRDVARKTCFVKRLVAPE
ncbi:MAG: hypothetical protein ACR2RL_16575 [Gammaproteobacteria bacterium]